MIIKHIAKVHKINEISNIRCAKLSIPFLLSIVLLHLSPDSGIEDASLLIFLSIDLLFPQSEQGTDDACTDGDEQENH